MELTNSQRRMLQRVLMAKGPGVGNWSPGKVTLIVGDRATRKNVSKLPFIHPDGCAPWLADQMDLVDANEDNFYWINAYSFKGVATDASFIEELKPIRVIALGAKADAWCEQNNIPHISVPHPQYWRRFHSKERYPLLDLIA